MSENQKPQWGMFLASIAVIAVIWLGLFPFLTKQPATAARIERLEQQGIDPSAMFYTDLDIIEDVSLRLEQKKSRHSHALWIPVKAD